MKTISATAAVILSLLARPGALQAGGRKRIDLAAIP
jgi:hypothetical protein